MKQRWAIACLLGLLSARAHAQTCPATGTPLGWICGQSPLTFEDVQPLDLPFDAGALTTCAVMRDRETVAVCAGTHPATVDGRVRPYSFRAADGGLWGWTPLGDTVSNPALGRVHRFVSPNGATWSQTTDTVESVPYTGRHSPVRVFPLHDDYYALNFLVGGPTDAGCDAGWYWAESSTGTTGSFTPDAASARPWVIESGGCGTPLISACALEDAPYFDVEGSQVRLYFRRAGEWYSALSRQTACDGGAGDAGAPDAGAPDAGTDAGTDAGPPDAGPPDAGADAGPSDAGSTDAGNGSTSEPQAARTYWVGCDCGTGEAAWPVGWLLPAALVARPRRRSR